MRMRSKFVRLIPTLILFASAALILRVAQGMLSHGRPTNYTIAVHGDPPHFSLQNPNNKPLEVASFTVVYRNFKANRHEELWTLVPKVPELKALAIDKITYGEVPPGWAEKAPAKPIDMNRPNQLVVTTKTNRFYIDIQAGDNWKTNGMVTQD